MSPRPEVPRPPAWELFLRVAWARAYPRIFAVNRDPSWVLFEVLLPLLSVVSFVYIYRALEAPPVYTGFVILGGAMTAYWMNVLWSMAAQFFWEKNDGNLQLYFLSPAPPAAILAGMALGGMFTTSVRAVSMLVLGSWLFRVSYLEEGLPAAVGVFLLTLVALYGMGACFASLYLFYGREAWHTNNLLSEPIFLISGFYFPVKALGPALAAVGSVVPLTLGLDAVRQLALGPELGWLPVPVEAGLLVVLTGLYLWGAVWGLRTMERLSRREGRLTLRWQ